MNYASTRTRNFDLSGWISKLRENNGLLFGSIIAIALIFFELFNYSTTDFALKDLLGDLRFAGIRWSTTLSIAFCAIDFAGIARLFAPDHDEQAARAVWYLFGAWLLAATMNAVLTWWGVSMAIVNHSVQSSVIVSSSTILMVVPVFVAIMVWVIRILVIGSISTMGNYLFNDTRSEKNSSKQVNNRNRAAQNTRNIPNGQPVYRGQVPKPAIRMNAASASEPTYHSVTPAPKPQRYS